MASVPRTDRDDGTFVLARDGREELARTDGHGDWVKWLQAQASLAAPGPTERQGRRVARVA